MIRRAIIAHDRFVQVRDQPSMRGEVIGRLQPKQAFAVLDSCGAWLRLPFAVHAYVLRRLTADLPDAAGLPSLRFDAERAAAYAENHSANSLSPLCPNRNRGLPAYAADCANFVHQCLAAGGLTVFDGWLPKLKGLRGTVRNGWTLTDTGRCALLSRGRMTEIPPEAVRRGDVIYTYRPNAPHPYRYSHVVLAVGDYDPPRRSCLVCGHTRHQRRAEKKLDAARCRCYRINESFTPWADERRLILPEKGDGAKLEVAKVEQPNEQNASCSFQLKNIKREHPKVSKADRKGSGRAAARNPCMTTHGYLRLRTV